MKSIIIAALALSVVPTLAQAAAYNYVDSAGNVGVVMADTWTSALASAPGIHPRSGVALVNSADGVGGTLEGVILPDIERYQYVNQRGEVKSTEAMSPAQAFEQAENIALHSGVILAEEDPIPAGEEVEL